MAKHQNGFYRQEWKLRREYADWVCDVNVNFFPCQYISQHRHSMHLRNQNIVFQHSYGQRWSCFIESIGGRIAALSSHLIAVVPPPLLSPLRRLCPLATAWREQQQAASQPKEKASSSPLSSSIHPLTPCQNSFSRVSPFNTSSNFCLSVGWNNPGVSL